MGYINTVEEVNNDVYFLTHACLLLYHPMNSISSILQTYTCTLQYRYNAVYFLTNIHKRHPKTRPLGRGMGCLLWIQHLIDILLQLL